MRLTSPSRVAARYLRARRQRLTVYRVGEGAPGSLSNRNAASLGGIIAFLDDECEEYVLDFCMPNGVITEYEVVIEGGFGPYTEFRGGHARGMSKDTGMAGKRKGRWAPVVWYSFPAAAEGLTGTPGHWEVVKVGKKVRVKSLPKRMLTLGWEEALRVLKSYF